MGLLKEDPYIDSFKPQAELVADYERVISISKSDIINRFRLKILFANKSYAGSRRKTVKMNRLAANEFKLQ